MQEEHDKKAIARNMEWGLGIGHRRVLIEIKLRATREWYTTKESRE
jgi:hypothetical protein